MRAVLLAVLLAVLPLFPAMLAPAFTADQLAQEFDARLLTEQEKRFLQVGLAVGNQYNGRIDGA